MEFTILAVALMFALISMGVGMFITNRKSYAFPDIHPIPAAMTIGSIFLILTNVYSLIRMIKSLFSSYTEDLIVYNMGEPIQTFFSQIFSLAIILLYISVGVLLLIKKFKLAFLAVSNIFIFTLVNSIFVSNINLIDAYILILPTVAILTSLLIVFAAVGGKGDTFYRYSKLLKVAPYLSLLNLVNIIFSLIESPRFDASVIIELALVILSFLAFLWILNTLASIATRENTTSVEVKATKKEKIFIILSVLISPAIIYLVSSIDKMWLFVGGVILAIVLPFVLCIETKKKTKVIAVIITLAIVVLLCVVTKVFQATIADSGSGGVCGICGGDGVVKSKIIGDGTGVQVGFDTYYRCKGCHGKGISN